MNWKTRQMFSDREHGIVSGLSPVNMTGGGNVPYPRSYQEGGTVPEEISIEQRVAALAAQKGISVPEARVMILLGMIEGKGITLSNEILNQYATGLITLQDALAQTTEAGSGASTLEEKAKRGNIGIGVPYSSIDSNVLLEEAGPPMMQDGGLALDLFERGDQDINEVLNTSVDRMSGSVNPPLSGVGPTEKVEETVTEDQGPTDTEAGKAPFQQMAVEVVKEATMSLAREDYMNTEQVQQDVEQQLNAIDETYRQQTGATDTILTEEFLAQLDNLMLSAGDEFENAPGMEEGTNDKDATTMDMTAIIEAMASAGADPAEIKKVIEKYYPGGTGMSDEMLQNRISRARRGALLGGKTKQGGWAGMMDILGQADAAEVAAMGSMPETLAANEAALKRLAMSGELEAAGGSTGGGLTAKMREMKLATAIRASGLPEEEQGVYLSILTGDKSRAELDQALWAKILDRAMVWGASSPAGRSEEEVYQYALALWKRIGQTSAPPPVEEGAGDGEPLTID